MNEPQKEKLTWNKNAFFLPVLMIAVGIGWLFTSVNSDVNWIWTSSLAVIGIMTLVVSGIDKFSIVVGPFFLFASFMSILRQLEMISLSSEMPCLLIAFGFFMGIAQIPAIKSPEWLKESN